MLDANNGLLKELADLFADGGDLPGEVAAADQSCFRGPGAAAPDGCNLIGLDTAQAPNSNPFDQPSQQQPEPQPQPEADQEQQQQQPPPRASAPKFEGYVVVIVLMISKPD